MRRLLRLSVCAALLALAARPGSAGRQHAARAAARGGAPLDEGQLGADGRRRLRPPDRAASSSRTTPSCPLHPASNEKLATTYAALAALGPSFRIETDVLGEGTQDGTTWQGDIVLKGYGDPTLSAADLRSLAHQVARDGITRVNGRVIGDESWFDTRRVGARLEARVLPPRVAGALGAHRRPRLERTRGDAARALRGAALPPLPRRGRRLGARAGADRRRARESDGARLRRLAAARLARPLHGHVERQLHRRDAPEAGRRRAARRGDGGRRSRGDARAARRGRRAAAGDPDRRRLGPLAHRPLDGRGPRRRAARRCGSIPTSARTSRPRCRSPA